MAKVSVFEVFLFNWQEKHFNNFYKSLYIGFRATLNLRKNDVPLNPMYRFASKLAHLLIMFVRQKTKKFIKLSSTSFEIFSLER